MKFIYSLSLLFLSFLVSCSSSNDDAPTVPSEYFNLKYEGVTANVTQFQAVKRERRIAVTAVAEDGLGIAFEFNELGDIGEASVYPATAAASASYDYISNYRNYPSNYFTFTLVNLDSQAKTVEVSFSGNLYEDSYALGGVTKLIEGSFKVKYTEVAAEVPGLGFSADFNGSTFLDSNGLNSGGFFSGSDISLINYNSSEYIFSLNVNHDNTATGTYNFNSSSSVNNVVLSKFDIPSESYIDYSTVGVLNITEKTVGPQLTIIAGTFSFIATNPNDNSQITVTNGNFKQIYENY